MSSNTLDLDAIIKEIGQFGKYQLMNYILISIPIFFIGICSLSYIFTTEDLNYRCLIPNCDNTTNTEYNPEWLKYAVPFEDNRPLQCGRYVPSNETITQCSEEYFTNISIEGDCEEYVFETDEENIVNEVKCVNKFIYINGT